MVMRNKCLMDKVHGKLYYFQILAFIFKTEPLGVGGGGAWMWVFGIKCSVSKEVWIEMLKIKNVKG